MQTLSLKEIAKLAKGELNNERFEMINISNLSIDTRTLQEGDLYMPIIGEVFDGHKFIQNAIENGAAAIFCEKSKYENPHFPTILVDNVNESLLEFAKNYKNKFNVKIISLTGSNGKTTTKDLLSSVLEEKFTTIKTKGNLNNHIGLPLTMLNLSNNTQALILEMGTDGFGQIEVLSNTANPDIAIITNIGDSHLEQLKTKENIAIEKLHIVDGLKENGYFLYNNDDEVLKKVVENSNITNIRNTISFGFSEDSNYKIELLESDENGSSFKLNGEIFNIPLVGRHQIYNSAVSIIVGQIFEIEKSNIISALSKKEITKMRSEILNIGKFDILDDSYKSNPQAVISALDTLSLLKKYERKIVILGDMLELGENENELHANISTYLDPEQIDYVLLYGPLSKFTYDNSLSKFSDQRIFHYSDKSELSAKVKQLITENSIVLVKASRSMHLEDVVEDLKNISE